MQQRVFLISALIVLSLPGLIKGQLVADEAYQTETNYATSAENHSVFCFSPDVPMSIRYESNGDENSYSWYQYNVADNSWDTPLATTGNQLIVNEPGGYRVVVENSSGDVIDDDRCWVFNTQALNNLEAEIGYDDCFSVELNASADSVPLLYYDPLDGAVGAVDYQKTFEWVAESDDEQQEGQSVTFTAPFEDLTYTVTVSDRFGNNEQTSIDYSAIAVEASFETDILKDTVEHERHDEARGSAPIEIRFTDESLGKVTAREWDFGTSGSSVERNPLFVFTKAGTDSVTLRVVNRNSGCESISDPFVVNIWESELDVPNVFTPNGDGINDEFRVAYKSIKKFEMVVFNRWGRRVYESNDPQKGWDGKVGGSTGAPGVYFYYIKAEGYNKEEVHKKEGAVHLIRGK